jgi:hypothetical protein
VRVEHLFANNSQRTTLSDTPWQRAQIRECRP